MVLTDSVESFYKEKEGNNFVISPNKFEGYKTVKIKKGEKLKIYDWNYLDGYVKGFRKRSKKEGIYPKSYIKNCQYNSNN